MHGVEQQGYRIERAVLTAAVDHWRGEVALLNAATARNLLALPAFAELAQSAELRALVEPVLGPAARPVRGLLFDKQAGANWSVAWRQDTVIAVAERPEESPAGFEAWSVKQGVAHVRPPARVLENMLTVRLALDAADDSNGALRVLPGLHNRGLLDQQDLEEAVRTNRSALCETAAGDAVLMRPLLPHASSKAARSGRRVVHFEYASAGLPAPLRWAEWR